MFGIFIFIVIFVSMFNQYDKTMTTFKITNVKEDKKYKGSYSKIFKILNRDVIFGEGIWETDESKGYVNGVYFLQISDQPQPNQLEEILKIKNVELINQ